MSKQKTWDEDDLLRSVKKHTRHIHRNVRHMYGVISDLREKNRELEQEIENINKFLPNIEIGNADGEGITGLFIGDWYDAKLPHNKNNQKNI